MSDEVEKMQKEECWRNAFIRRGMKRRNPGLRRAFAGAERPS